MIIYLQCMLDRGLLPEKASRPKLLIQKVSKDDRVID